MKKEIYKSKAGLGAILLVIIAAYQIYTSGSLQFIALAEIGAALGIYGIRDAMNA